MQTEKIKRFLKIDFLFSKMKINKKKTKPKKNL